MPNIGIDLSATRCHLIEVHAAAVGVSRRSSAIGAANVQETRITAFETIPYGWSDSAALVSALRQWLSTRKGPRQAWVTVWGLSWAHQLMRLPPGKPSDLARLARQEAVRDVALLGQTEVITGVMAGSSQTDAQDPAKREVAFIAVSASDIRARIQPLVNAGFVIEGVTVPPLALCSLARLRSDIVPETPVALLSVGPNATAMAFVRDGLLLFAREAPWGYQGADARGLDREQFATKLAAELRRSIRFFRQTNRADIAQVLLCGDAPQLRSLTAPLIAELDLETETLDSLAGIVSDALPYPADVFRDQVAKFRLAWAMAADAAPPINLVPPEIVIRRRARRHAAALTGGVAAAVLAGLAGYGYVDRTVRSDELQVRELEQQVAALEPRARQVERVHRDVALADTRRGALDAFDSQGPRLARELEVLARSASPDVTLQTLRLQASEATWTAHLSGVVVSPNPARAQAAMNDFLRVLQRSPYLGAAVAPPSLHMIFGATSPTQSAASTLSALGSTDIPRGMSGIEFNVAFEIRK